ncbi:MAG: hypothetical protein KDC54_08655, partial [Lewinella sp.]|nr:hypothetical protein [Lewinella sp.]
LQHDQLSSDGLILIQSLIRSGVPKMTFAGEIKAFLYTRLDESACDEFDQAFQEEPSFLVLERFLLLVIEREISRKDAQLLLNLWLICGGRAHDVLPYVYQWLDRHGDGARAFHVFEIWLETTKSIRPLESYCRDWLKSRKEDANTRELKRKLEEIEGVFPLEDE